jgi:hypothetical protein
VLVIDPPVGTAIGGRFRAAGIRSLGAEEYEPDDTQDQNGKAGGNRQEREHGRSRFGLPRLGWGFNDLMVPLDCHGGLDLTFRRSTSVAAKH